MPITAPDHTAVRVALWRALHAEIDAPPCVFDDRIGLRLAAPEDGWRDRPDMDPRTTSPMRAGIVARARFLEDLLAERIDRGVDQYVLLGAGLDSFAQRRPELAARLTVFEVDQPGTQAWKRQRLGELGLAVPDGLRWVPVDFEVDSWWERLTAAGFDPGRPAVVASTGVSMYLHRETNIATLQQLSTLAPGSTLAMTFMLPLEAIGAQERQMRRFAEQGARASGTPFVSFFRPDEIVALAEDSGFGVAEHISHEELIRRYFADRTDGLLPAESEQILVART
ncbi:class I SAM-dependent methyltransferase [Nocardia amikacinitolerans]|uniref:class I SAM-dependent methyltransferase n=1 Tax=Nocardia amikacinitolerans TaxID=756689 RepID=UPI0020A5B01A|nr:class I SAM-dependent methyltransferase [Nocardia amikacinitolerans]MCP2288415.1 methyltransferase, TIGR00027 family [Nocardia amikacinitolerans]